MGRTPALAQRVSKRRLRLRGSNGVPTRVVNIKPLCTHASPAAALVATWSFSRMRNAVTQIPGSGSVAPRRLGLGFPMKELTADALQLPADIEFGAVEVHRAPGQPDHLTLAQTQDKDQHIGGVERVLVPLRRLQKLTGLLGASAAPREVVYEKATS